MNNDNIIEEKCTLFDRAFANAGGDYDGSLSPLKDFLRTALLEVEQAGYTRGKAEKHEEIARRLNRVMNRHSKSITEGGLDYVKAFETMEKLEHELFMEMSRFTPTDNNKEATSN